MKSKRWTNHAFQKGMFAMKKLFGILSNELKNGEQCVLVTVVANHGSTPRGAGAHMLVTAKGRLYGTIGGGAVEFQSEKTAREVLKSKKSRIEWYRLHENQVQDLGMICGGDVQVYFRYIPAYDASVLALAEKVEDLYLENEQFWLISEITSEQHAVMGVYGKKSGSFGIDVPSEVVECLGNKLVQLKFGGRTFYAEMLLQAGKVYIFGGGHVAQALVPALHAVGFRCTVLEDRVDFCRPELFIGVEETRLIDNDHIADYVSLREDDYVVIMTRGHKDDQKIQAQVLRMPARYIGVIGSRRKSEAVFANLREMGFSEQNLQRITTPIGLEIQAETPEEIAVSITAQMILKRATT
jgi:xanthine dehydrogenase accessory factor